jgi:hypothetical protein
LPDEWVSAIFAKIRTWYGHQWTSRFANAQEYEFAKLEWAEKLGNLDAEQIRRGLEVWDGTSPPNVYEFRRACQEPKKIAAHKRFEALPKPKCDPDIAIANIEKLKQSL